LATFTLKILEAASSRRTTFQKVPNPESKLFLLSIGMVLLISNPTEIVKVFPKLTFQLYDQGYYKIIPNPRNWQNYRKMFHFEKFLIYSFKPPVNR